MAATQLLLVSPLHSAETVASPSPTMAVVGVQPDDDVVGRVMVAVGRLRDHPRLERDAHGMASNLVIRMEILMEISEIKAGEEDGSYSSISEALPEQRFWLRKELMVLLRTQDDQFDPGSREQVASSVCESRPVQIGEAAIQCVARPHERFKTGVPPIFLKRAQPSEDHVPGRFLDRLRVGSAFRTDVSVSRDQIEA